MSTLKVDTILKRTGTGTITVGQSGDTISIPSGATLNSAGTNTLEGIANTPAFKVELASNQSIPNGTNTKIAWDSEIYDTDNAFASNKFTVPSGKGGNYHFSGIVIMRNIDDNESVSLRIHVNGSDTLNGLNVYRMNQYGTGADKFITLPISIDINLSASDYVEVFLYHDEGGSQDVDAGYSSFCGYKLIGV